MKAIEQIMDKNRPTADIIADLKNKSIIVPAWGGKKGLLYEYDPKKHPVMDKSLYPDIVDSEGKVEKVTRVTYNLQQLAVKRMTELCCGIPVKRVYAPTNDRQSEVATYLEKIYQRNRIDSVINERLSMLFAGCEVMTLWYAIEDRNNLYGFDSPLKFRCRNFSPMNGDELYPLFDEYGDLIALSIGYKRKVGTSTVSFFDAYTADAHYKWSNNGGGEYTLVEDDNISTIGKIPAVYMYRPTPIWEDTSKIVYEIEWAVSRNGNYLRKNSKPIFCVFADQAINYGNEGDENSEYRSILQYPQGSSAGYVTWTQAIDSLKFHIDELRQSFFTQLQLPDWSYEKMSQQALSGESRKQLFIDSMMKVKDESGRLVEFLDREVNVVKAFLKIALGEGYGSDIDTLQVETQITPFSITDEKDTINNLITANGGKPIISQRESVEQLGWSDNVDETMREIQEESLADALGLAQ